MPRRSPAGSSISERPHRAAEILRGLKDVLPVLIGVAPLGLALGAQAAHKGLAPGAVALMTGLNFAGGSEFAAVGLWANPLPVALIVLMTALVNSRHLLMGATLAPLIAHLPRWKAFAALFWMCDESWAMAYADAQKRRAAGAISGFSLPYYAAVALGVWIAWIGSCTAGAVIGPAIGDIRAFGVDMALPAVFLAITKGLWRGHRAARPWLVSLIVAALTYLLVPGAWYVATGAVAGLIAARFWAPSA